jgi:hypothetical protein
VARIVRAALAVAAASLVASVVTPAHGTPARACTARTLVVRFDPRGTLSVVGDGHVLASATNVKREVAPGCAAPVDVSPPYTPKAIKRRTTVTCRVKHPLQIEAHPIVPAGSQLIVSERDSDTWEVSAVLQPGRSRLYVFSQSCKTS